MEEMIRGDTLPLHLVLSIDGSPIDVGGDTIYFTLKTNQADDDALAPLRYSYTLPHNSNTAVGIADVSIPASATSVVTPGTYFFDIQWKRAVTPIEVYTVALGKIVVRYDITISTA
jgi:hypothetical protein